ncbi:MAG: protein kinase domain-containing protein [Planctomycetota bacterium]|jgi:serine/threonine protein kinase/Tol biopolymer transport system component
MGDTEERNDKRPKGKGAGPTRSFDSSVTGPGSQIGPFRIEQELGRGAVGVVYLAHDTKLDREVAIKSLPAEVMANPKARSRFSREARVLASLNHPNIATIYEEFEEAKGVGYLILEYVPGQTLAERIAKKSLKLEEALSIALQIAEAVSAAHEHDVIHRDLKPGNIKITPEGKVKVLDFGLAKAVGGEAADQQSTVTEPGRVIGTPAYMSPEQARGQATDKRSDIWAFGCVLYEMLTGRIPFKGETISDTLVNILQSDPNWQALPETTPTNIQVLLRRCLEKDPHRRLRDIGDAGIEISETLNLPAAAPPITEATPIAARPSRWRLRVAWGLAGLLVVVAAVSIGINVKGWMAPPASLSSAQRQQMPNYFKEPLPEDTSLLLARGGSLAWSPDGQQLVYAAVDIEGISRLHLVTFGEQNQETRTQVLRGTEKASGPFFSPDGQWIGFFWVLRNAYLKKVSIHGEEPQTLCPLAPWPCGGSWQSNGKIIYSPIFHFALEWTSATALDGRIHALTTLNREHYEYGHLWPDVLPGGGMLFTVLDESNKTKTKVRWQEDDPPRDLILNSSQARYVSTGHLLFLRNDALWAVPFDLEERTLEGEPQPVIHSLGRTRFFGAQFAVSANGRRLAFASGQTPLGIPKANLVWVDPTDKSPQKLNLEEAFYSSNSAPRLSPDEDQIALNIADQWEMQLADLRTGRLSPVRSRGYHLDPVWMTSPDGIRLGYADLPAGEPPYMVWQQQDGTQEILLRNDGEAMLPGCFYQGEQGQILAFSSFTDEVETGDTNIGTLNIETGERTKWTGDPWDQWGPEFSPDGKWVVYSAIRNDKKEIWVKPYPEGLGKPIADGAEPAWGPKSRSGRYELYFRNETHMMKVSLTGDSDLDFSTPEQVFRDDYVKADYPRARNYDIAKDGRFLMVQEIDKQPPPVAELNIVINWHKVLEGLWP